jgi:glycosyltransferase involved in cell wall biosynthesis
VRILLYNWRDWQHPHAGGAEIYTHEVAEQWVQQGHEVVLFCGAAEGLPALDISQGVTIVRRGTRFTVYREARKFYEAEGVGKFDLVIDEINTRPFLTPTFVKDAPVVALIHQVAREVWFHQFPFPANLAGRFYFERRWLKQYRDVPVVTVSESSRASLEQYGLHHAVTVPEGINLEHGQLPEAKKESAPTVLFCGRLTRNKRPHHAISAFNNLVRRIPEATMWVVGDGEMLPALRRRAHPNVSFLGRVSHDEKFELMAKAHVLVATSVREGWGLVVTEAASVGTPAIAYDVAGLRDSVRASNGLLVKPDPISLADQLEKTLPHMVDGKGPVPVVGGVAPWSEVATGILEAAASQTSANKALAQGFRA